jgi:signal transduction histidine kinase
MRLARRSWRPHPLILAIVATIGAAVLVFYLQHRAITTLQSQTQVIVRQLSEQAAEDVAREMRRTLDGPIFDTLAAVNHPDLRAGRLDLVARQFSRGLEAYPHVERFFAWRAAPGAGAADVKFFGRTGEFSRDPDLGSAVLALARHHARAQQIYVAAEGVGPQPRHVFLRLFWADARRLEYFAVLGFAIDPASMPRRLFADPQERGFGELLARRGGDLPLQLRVTDEHNAVVYGDLPAGVRGARLSFPMLFYPAEDIRSRLAAGVPPRQWAIEVGVPELGGALAGQGYWPTAFSVTLMLVALGLTVQAHRRSAELARMQTDFVAHVSHQLKTPLSLLTAATETLQMDRIRSPEKLADYLDTIRAEAQRLSALVQRVLEFSRVQQPRSYELESVDLGALVRETVNAFAHGLASRHVRFDVRQSGPGPFVLADPAALEQVVANLLDNAVKYSAPGEPVTVSVRAERLMAIVEVTDRGVGIARADQERIFERFYRAPGAAQRPGFGLGLPIVRELVHAHNGRVDVASTPGAGSTFRVTLHSITPRTESGRALRYPEAVP